MIPCTLSYRIKAILLALMITPMISCCNGHTKANEQKVKLILQVSLDAFIRDAANNPDDKALNIALEATKQGIGNSDSSFVSLFGAIYHSRNPQVQLATLFTKPTEPDIHINSTNEAVLAVLNAHAVELERKTFKVLHNRIHLLAVDSITDAYFKKSGIVKVTFLGVYDTARLRSFLQSEGSIDFCKVYANSDGILHALTEADNILGIILYGKHSGKEENGRSGTDNSQDTGSLGHFLSADASRAKKEETSKKDPLFAIMYPAMNTAGDAATLGATVGYVLPEDTGAVRHLLSITKKKFPVDAKFLFGIPYAANDSSHKSVLPVYMIRLPATEMVINNERIRRVSVEKNKQSGKYSLYIEMDAAGTERWLTMTDESRGGYIAIVLNNSVISAPLVNDVVTKGNVSIDNEYTLEQATDIANTLTSGKLPLPVTATISIISE